jgi:hypothetical protein
MPSTILLWRREGTPPEESNRSSVAKFRETLSDNIQVLLDEDYPLQAKNIYIRGLLRKTQTLVDELTSVDWEIWSALWLLHEYLIRNSWKADILNPSDVARQQELASIRQALFPTKEATTTPDSQPFDTL